MYLLGFAEAKQRFTTMPAGATLGGTGLAAGTPQQAGINAQGRASVNFFTPLREGKN